MSTEPSCLLDTGVVIAWLRGLAEVTSLLSHLVEKGSLAVSAITVLEVWQGAKEREIKATRAFFDGVRVIALDQFLAEKAGLLVQQLRRSGITISLPDASIAATALRLGIPILTTNRKHFAPVPHLQVWDLKDKLSERLEEKPSSH